MTNKKRILHVIDGLGLGGAQTLIENLLAEIRDVYDFELVALHGPGTLSERLETLGIPVSYLAQSKFDPRILPRLRAKIRSGNYDCVHAHLIPSTFICERFRRYLGIRRLVTHIHNLYGHHTGYAYQRILEWGLYRNLDAIVGCSRMVLASLPRRVNPKIHCAVIYNGVSADRYTVVELEDRANIRASWGIKENDFLLGTTGRLTSQKNLIVLLNALENLKQRKIPFRYLMVGSGPDESSLKRKVQELKLEKHVIMTGFQDDVPKLLCALDVYLLPSRYEGMPLALIEAMLTGVCCISSDWPGSDEIIESDKSGVIVPRGDSEKLAYAIEKLYRDTECRQTIAQEAYQRARQCFTINACARELSEFYKMLMDE